MLSHRRLLVHLSPSVFPVEFRLKMLPLLVIRAKRHVACHTRYPLHETMGWGYNVTIYTAMQRLYECSNLNSYGIFVVVAVTWYHSMPNFRQKTSQSIHSTTCQHARSGTAVQGGLGLRPSRTGVKFARCISIRGGVRGRLATDRRDHSTKPGPGDYPGIRRDIRTARGITSTPIA